MLKLSSSLRIALLSLPSFFLGVAAHAQAPSAEDARAMAARRAATLTRGVNLSGWFGGWGDYSAARTDTYLSPADLKTLKALGIRYVRFGFDPALLTRGGVLAQTPEREALWKRVDDALDQVLDAGLSVDFVVFPRDDYKQTLATQGGADQFVMLWQVLARHLVRRDPERMVFELMNESEVADPYRWLGIQSRAAFAIRQIAPNHTILASGAHYDSIPDLLEMQPLADPNVIYTFHFYEPYQFTHQGATWGLVEWNDYKNIPYPATPEQVAALNRTIPSDTARYQLYLYGAGGWNAQAIRERIAFAAAWGREHGVPVLCNEFGAYRDTAPADSRTRYLHDVRTGLEANGIGWAMWDWSGNFGLAQHTGGSVVVSPENVEALGLRQP